jgi:chromosome segregation ATPase
MNPLESLRQKIDMLKQKRDQLRQEAEMERSDLGQIDTDLARMEADRHAKLMEIRAKSDKKQNIQLLIGQSEQALHKMQQSATQLQRAMDEALGQ